MHVPCNAPFAFLVRSRRKRRCRFQHLSAAGPGKVGSSLGAWCPSTKGQGLAGREAPRRAAGTHVWAWGRGARRRRNKGLRGEKHHAEPPELTFVPEGVVPVDEGNKDLRGEKHHAGPEEETSVLPFRSARARPRAAPPPDGIKKRSCYSSSATS